MKPPHFINIFIVAGLLLIHAQSLSAKIFPVVISEVFYDSPLQENIANASGHHNGEFIELFNPTAENIKLDKWKIQDSSGNTSYTFPENTIIPARGLIIVAYQFPNSNFKLSNLFPSINNLGFSAETLQKKILYQSSIMLNNKSEIIRLYNENFKLVDQVSYNHTSTFDSFNGYWDICAHNGSYDTRNIPNLVSLQRNNIHYTYSSITPLASDFTVANATPLQKIVDDSNYPTLAELYDNTESNYSSNVEVGSLPGSSAVTPTGAATYQIPIGVPPGTNGMQPNLSVVYNSQGGFGVLGQGWDISGLSVISRGTQNFYFDAVDGKVEKTSIQFNSIDRLNLDGQRLLILNNGTNFADGTEYGTEVENYSRVKIKNSSVTGQIYFELTTKEGQIVEYGNTANSIVKNAENNNDDKILAWRINKITDVYGNSITYEYNYNGQYVSKISYINNTVEFAYQTNTLNPKQNYIGSFLTKQDKLLKSISTKQNSSVIKTYNFNYLTSDMDMRLDNISLTTSDGKTINPTRIQWGAESKIEEVKLDKMPDGNLNNVDNGYLYTGDIDGDGVADKITMWSGNYLTNEQGWIIATLTGKKSLPYVYFPATNMYPKFTQLVIGDINQDGKDEILLIGPFNRINIYGLSADENSMNLISFVDFPTSAYLWLFNDSYLTTPLLVNANNDKYIDLVVVPYVKNVRNEDHHYVCIPYDAVVFYGSSEGLKGTGFAHSINLGSTDDAPKGVYINPSIGDSNGDGKPELIQFVRFQRKESTNQLPGIDVIETSHWIMGSKYDELIAFYNSRLLSSYSIDANNDGLSDFLHFNQDFYKPNKHTWSLWTNNGSVNPTRTELNMHTAFAKNGGKYELDYSVPIDYNGDGYTDIIIADETFTGSQEKNYSSTSWYFYKNIGGNFKLENQINNTIPLSKIHPTVADINGDGIIDLIIGDRRGSSNNSHYFRAFTMPAANKRNVVHAISNGMGLTERFTYKYFSDYSKDAIDPTSPVRDLKAPVMTVDTFTDALGSKTTYTYEKPKVHIDGKGFLGFETVTTLNDVAKTKTITTYEYDKTFYNLSLKHQETFTTYFGGILSSLDITNTTKSVDGKRYMPQVAAQTSVDYLKNITQTTRNAYNSDGTLLSQEVKTGDNAVYNTTITEYSDYKKRNNNGIVSYLPQQIKVTNKRSGVVSDIINITELSYFDETGQLHTKKENIGLYGETLTSYTYHAKGQVNTATVKSGDIKESITTYDYKEDNYFLFPRNVKTTFNGVEYSNTSYTYDYTTGNVKTSTDNIIQQTVTSEYDSFGRKTKETQPNGTATTYKTEWSNAHPNAVYKSTTQSLNINQTAITYYDNFGREVYTTATGWKGQLVFSSKNYNAITGLLEKKVHPHYEGEPEKYVTYIYGDFAHRLTEEKFFDGINSLTTKYSYPYNSHSTTVKTPNGQTKTTVTDASGLVISVTDGGGTIEYKDFNAAGQPKTITSNGATTTIAYDEMGRKQSLTDPNAGTITYTYYADGQLDTQTSAKGELTKMMYDDAGRVQTKTVTNINGKTPASNVTTYTYVPNGENGVGQVQKIEQKLDGALSHKQEFTYNAHHQIAYATETYDNQSVTTAYGYDNLWRPTTTTTPSGLVTTDVYDSYGDVYQVKVGNKVIWEGKEQNSSGQWLKYTLGNGLQTNKTYSNRQELETIKTGTDNNGTLTPAIQNLVYRYDAPTGNLLTRKDILNNRNEDFTYDDLDRLLTAQLTGSVTYSQTMTYKPNGNIETKSDVGTYQYNTPRPHAMSGISGIQAGVSTDKQFIDYTTFNKVSEIRQGVDDQHITKKYNIYYGLDEQRIKSVYIDENNNTKTRYYFGAYEKDIDKFGNTTQTDYIYTPAGLTAMVKGGVLYYLHLDNLGSIQAITNESKAIVSSYYYTPWGGRVLLSGVNITDRGYTFHEHLTEFGLINMNGRVYDPVLARFLSPDPYVQAPDYTQNFNRYSYCYNNPFKYTDPSGELVWFIPVIIGAAIGAYSGWQVGKAHGATGLAMLGYMAGGAIIGGLSGYAGMSISTSLSTSIIASGGTVMEAAFVSGVAAGMVTGSISNGGLTALAGGNVGDIIGATIKGGVVGGFSGAASSVVFQGMNNLFDNTLGGLLKDILPTNTISYMVGSTASQVTANLLTGRKLFEDVDYGLNLGLLLPLSVDVARGVESFKMYMAKKYNTFSEKEILKSQDILSRTTLNKNGDLQLSIDVDGQEPYPPYVSERGVADELFSKIFSGQRDYSWIVEGVLITNYRMYIQMIYSLNTKIR